MKKTAALLASMAAASGAAKIFASSISGDGEERDSEVHTSCKVMVAQDGADSGESRDQTSSRDSSATSTDKFAPRFDGLRFIETLVTAHR